MLEIPLSPAQSGVWVNERLGGAGAVYHMPFALSFDGALDVAALVAAVDAVVDRHPVLAAAVAERDGVPWLVPARRRPAVEVREVSPELAERVLREEVGRPFDVEAGPLARFTLLACGPDRHRLVVVVHHLVFDGQSTDVFVRDLAAGYRPAGAAELPELPGRPAELVADEEARVEAARAGARAFWRTRWREPGEPRLPGLAGPVPAVDAGESVEFSVPEPLRAALAETAQRLGVSRFELILGSWHALLLRYGTEDPVVAVDLGTRTPATRDRIGLYVNELPVTTRPVPAMPFVEFVRRLRTDLRELYRFREVPLARAVPGLRPAVALAPVTLTYRRRAAAPEFPGVRVDVDWVIFPGTARGALRVHLVDGPDRLGAILQFAPRAVATAAVRRLAGHWLTLLAAALAPPDTPLAELPVLGAEERATLLDAGNRTAVGYPPVTLPDLVAAQLARSPDATAVVDTGTRLSYRDLDAATDRLAYRLRALGAGPDGLVGICVERGVDLVVGMLGVLKTGAAYLPLDPDHPADRLALILADAAVPLLVVGGRAAGALPGYGGTRVRLDEDPGAVEPVALPGADPDGRAYVIYTSGSTGRPKGVEIGHRALTNLLLAMRDRLAAGPGLTWLALTSPSFDISALELFLPLVVGGRVVVAGEADVRDGAALCRLADTHGVTHVQATPSGWRMLLESGFDRPAVDALCGGEALPLPLARELRARVRRLWNVYGPTETTIWSTAWEVPPAPDEVSIGRPIANTRAYVLDERREPVPVGVPGELYLGGDGLAHGYLGRPELTAARFVEVPSAGRLYRTGDLVRYAEDGRLTCLGRLDDQVKIRGYRIELGEVEARLLDHPFVAAAGVAVRADDVGQEHLLACVVPADGGPAEPAALRAHLARMLPDYMLPSAILAVPALPLTPNGKLDRRALPELPRTAPPSTPPQPPADGVAAQVADICREVLRRDAIGMQDSLFDLGAHSLTMTAIAARIRRRLKADLPLSLFYDDPTVASLAAAVAALVGLSRPAGYGEPEPGEQVGQPDRVQRRHEEVGVGKGER